MTRLANKIRFFRREDGNVSVESVFWVPFFVFLLTLVADAAFVFYGQARTLQIAEDGNRAYSTGVLSTAEATQEYIEDQLGIISPNAVAETTSYRGLITTVVTVPTQDLAVVGIFSALSSLDMHVVARMVREN